MKTIPYLQSVFSWTSRPEIALLHGNTVELLTRGSTIRSLSLDEFRQHRHARCLLLLAAPFVRSFVHETIPLTTKELDRVDQQLLGAQRVSERFRTVVCCRLDADKALTSHCHLTDQGSELLCQLHRVKSRTTWKPAIPELVVKLLDLAEQTLQPDETVRLYLSHEIIQVRKKSRLGAIQHLHYLLPHLSLTENMEVVDRILDDREDLKAYQRYSFQTDTRKTAQPAGPFLTRLLALKARRRPQKRFTQRQSRTWHRLRRFADRNILMAGCLFTILVWAAMIHYQERAARQERESWQTAVQKLEYASDHLQRIALQQQPLFRLQALLNAIEPLKMHPEYFFAALEPLLPNSIWIGQVALSRQLIRLHLLDSSETELTTLIEAFGQHLGKTSLEESETIQLGDRPLKRYRIHIGPLHPDLLRTDAGPRPEKAEKLLPL